MTIALNWLERDNERLVLRPLVSQINRLSLEIKPVEVQDFSKINDHLRGTYGMYLKNLKKY